MSKRITVHFQEKPCYQIAIESDFLSLISSLSDAGFQKAQKVCIVTDSNVGPLHLDQLSGLLCDYFTTVESFVVPAGENFKTLETVQTIYEFLIQKQFDRSDLLIAFGGGVVGDMTGYTAATYLRGIPFVQIPTTLLSQVDSSIGGKTGVDFLQYKNMVGAFHQPSLVYMNLSLLRTLPKEQYISGMGEIIKHGLIRNLAYYEWLIDHREAILGLDAEVVEEMIFESCLIKKMVVELDPTEKGDRALLNFGHTIGHAVEKLSGFTLLHGQCVALGMISASYLSCKYGDLSQDTYKQIHKTIEKFGFPVSISNMEAEAILQATKSDKKMSHGKIKFVLLKEVGNACLTTELTDNQILEGIQVLLNSDNK